MQSDIATISVITSGIVAISTILLPLFFNFISDGLKWRRERRLSEIDKIEKATTELMSMLSEKWAGNYYNSVGGHQDKLDWVQLQSRILNSFYVWERTLWSYSDRKGREEIMAIHQELETKSLSTNDDEGKARWARLSKEIHELTHNAVHRVK
jgi:hypothetical protein